MNFLNRSLRGLTGGQVIYQKLRENKVNDVWVSTGGAVMPLIDAFFKGDINYYLSSHEQNAGHAATGYAKSSGKTGISIVTSGPGLTNSVTALTDATNDSTPLIVFSGQVPLNAVGSNAFQECPAVEITQPITKWSYQIKCVEEIPYIIDKAFYVANHGKPGGVHIDLPKCVLASTYQNVNYNKQLFFPKTKKNVEKDVSIVADLISESERPVIIAGQGCNHCSRELTEFVLNSNIPITTTIHGMGCFDETYSLSLDFLGMHGSVAANYAVQNADLIIGLGTRFDDRITGNIKEFAPKAIDAFHENKGGIVHVNINKKEINNVLYTHFNYNMDTKDFLNQINNKLIKSRNNDWLKQINKWKFENRFKYKESINMKTQDVIVEINRYLLNNNITDYFISTGVGNHQMMAAQFIKWRYPNSMITSGSLGVMGVGLPYAIGTQIANPDSLVIDIDGDGSFNHTLSELKSVVDNNLPIKIAIMNDSKLSMVAAWERLFYNERYTATELSNNPDYCKLAESFNITSIRCFKKEDLAQKIKYFLEYDGPILADFSVESDLCLPLVSPGCALDDMLINPEDCNRNIENTLPPS